MAILNSNAINAKILENKKIKAAKEQSIYDKTDAVLSAFNKHTEKANDIMDTLFYALENKVQIKSDFKGIVYNLRDKSFMVRYEPMPSCVVSLMYYPRTGQMGAGYNRDGCFSLRKYPHSDKNIEHDAVRMFNYEREFGSLINDLIVFADKFPEYLVMVENEINRL